MRENHNFVVLVNILTLFVGAPFSWATRHTTICLYMVVNNQFDHLGNQRFHFHDIIVFKDVSISIFSQFNILMLFTQVRISLTAFRTIYVAHIEHLEMCLKKMSGHRTNQKALLMLW